MQVSVNWIAEAAFAGESGSGHRMIIDGPAEGGGRNLGARPMELLLLGMAACAAYDVVYILKKSRQEISRCEVQLNSQRAAEPPQVFTSIHAHFILSGAKLGEAQVQRAISLSAEKYCSASIMLGKTANITHDYEIIAASAA